jgi:uncharacterized membrane protein
LKPVYLRYTIKSGLRIITFLMLLFWCAGFCAMLLYKDGYLPAITIPFIKYSYSFICHQQDARCFNIYGAHLFVCARCTGIYTGAFLLSLVFIFIKMLPKISLNIIIYSILPLLADIILYNAGAYNYSKTIAFITGLFPGSVLILYILGSFEKFFKELKLN